MGSDDVKEYRRILNTKLWAYKDKLLSDKRIGEKRLEQILNNALILSEYCIDRFELKQTQKVADMYRYVHTVYLEDMVKWIYKTDAKAKKEGLYVTRINIYNVTEDDCDVYFNNWFDEKEDVENE